MGKMLGGKQMFNNNNANQTTKGSLKSLKKLHIFAYAFIAISLAVLLGSQYHVYGQVTELHDKYEDIQKTSQKSQEANEKVLAKLEEIRDEQLKIEQRQAQMMQVKMEHEATIMHLKANGFSPYDDLGDHTNLTVEDMNRIIDFYDSQVGTGFTGQGEVFIKASQQTGLSPIYIFAHAACESSYGKSNLALDRGNYFGINAVDTNPNAAYAMGNNLEEGIIAGAMWIKTNYYDNGYTSLQSMKDAGYATSNTWVSSISSIANTSIGAI